MQGRSRGQLLSVEQVAKLLGFSEKSIYRWIRAGRLACVSIRVAEADVIQFTEQNRVIHESARLDCGDALQRLLHAVIEHGQTVADEWRSNTGRARGNRSVRLFEACPKEPSP